jgi:hypothetical protein
MLSSTIPDRYVRPAIAFVIFASGLKYIGLQTTALGWVLCATLLAVAVAWLVFTRPWRAGMAPADASELLGDQEPQRLVGDRKV